MGLKDTIDRPSLFEPARQAFACPIDFCKARCTAQTCKCARCFCDRCKNRALMARRPKARPQVRYLPTQPTQHTLFKETTRS